MTDFNKETYSGRDVFANFGDYIEGLNENLEDTLIKENLIIDKKILFISELQFFFTDVVHYRKEFNKMVENNEPVIITTDLGSLSFDLLSKGYKLFLLCDDTIHELVLGKNDWIRKELRPAHNLYKLVVSAFNL
jgi:hypothetical protein